MQHDVDPVWVLATSYTGKRWRDWLERCRAPEMQQWAESRHEKDPKRGVSTLAYRLPGKVPPPEGDEGAREQVYQYIRFRRDLSAAA